LRAVRGTTGLPFGTYRVQYTIGLFLTFNLPDRVMT
jgi:hypothetical protein